MQYLERFSHCNKPVQISLLHVSAYITLDPSSALLRQFWRPPGPVPARLGPGEQWPKAGPQLQQRGPAALLLPLLLLVSLLPGRRRLRPETVAPRRQRGLPQRRGLRRLGREGRPPNLETSAGHQVARREESAARGEAGAGRGAEGGRRLLAAPRRYTQLCGGIQTHCQEHKT